MFQRLPQECMENAKRMAYYEGKARCCKNNLFKTKKSRVFQQEQDFLNIPETQNFKMNGSIALNKDRTKY